MGNHSSNYGNIKNHFELTIRMSKDLECLLKEETNAQGKGLIELLTSARNHNGKHVPETLQKKIKTLGRERNKLIHERDYNKIKDIDAFRKNYADGMKELQIWLGNHPDKGCVVC